MDVQEVIYDGNKKFMWDGESYDSRERADAVRSDYETAGFEVRLVENESKFFVYTRRVVTEIVLEGEAPP